jgi:hypothetical protein
MSRRFHSCGIPVDLDGSESLTHTWVHYGKTADPERRALASCPRCGELLAGATEPRVSLHPATTLREWCQDWPDMRNTLEAELMARQQREPSFYGYEAETILRELEYLLHRVADLAAGLSAPVDEAVSHVS